MLIIIIICSLTYIFLYMFDPVSLLKAVEHVSKELKNKKISSIEIDLSEGIGLRNRISCVTEKVHNVRGIELEDQKDEDTETEFGLVTKRTEYFLTSKIIFYIQPFK